ncbi:MAG: phosphonate C-P lyase system protein PhnG [Thermodesulfobacteriota bacterium]|nr:phosphonate C-P lyase system protein PhnG [Thermodesulfobacteriota bacterium]
MPLNKNGYTKKERQQWMSILAKSSSQELEDAWQELSEKPIYRHLHKSETGSIMVRGRAGGSGIRFNLGEMTATRCTIQIVKGHVGSAYVMGRDHRHAELVAIFDALLQDPLHHNKISSSVVSSLKVSSDKRKEEVSKKSAATKVDFFTMVRGE